MNRPRGKPFEVGNKMGRGRPKGSRNKKTKEVLKMLEDFSVPLMSKCLKMAFDDGDFRPLALYIEKIAPVLRDSAKKMKLPKLPEMPQLSDIEKLEVALVNKIAEGKIDPVEGHRYHAMLQAHRQNRETAEIRTRLSSLEELQRNASDEVGTP